MSVRSVIRNIAFPVVMICICVVVTLLVIRVNQSADELKQQGKPATNVVTAIAGDRGDSAYDVAKRNGFSGTESEWLTSLIGAAGASIGEADIQQAVRDYCTDGRCDGDRPTVDQITQAVVAYCSDSKCKGRDGRDAPFITEQQIASAVATYCTDSKCVGPKGDSVAGQDGINGTNGRTPKISCVSRPLNNATARYIAWKYEDEADDAYRNLYKLPTWAEASDCVDVS